MLKNLGFKISAAEEILDKYENAEEMEQFLTIKKRELEGQGQILRQRIRQLDSTIEWLRKDGNMTVSYTHLDVYKRQHKHSI